MSVGHNSRIIFDESTATFMPGQTITGRVLILTRNPMKTSCSVTIKFRGKCEIIWTKSGQSMYRRHITGKELYLNNKTTLFCNKGESQLEVGKYVYPFNFVLPRGIPPTFFCKYGFIRYNAEVKIVRHRRSDVKLKLMFVVISPINLNNIPSLSKPRFMIKQKSYSYGCLLSGSMKLVASIPYCGFVPGQTIPITVTLDNNTDVNINHIIIRLERKWKIKAYHTTSYKKDIVYRSIIGVKKGTSKTGVVQIKIPNSLMVLDFEHCKVITDSFTLHVEPIGHGKVSIDIMLGNIPLITAFDAHQNNQSHQLAIQKYCSCTSIPTNSFPFVN